MRPSYQRQLRALKLEEKKACPTVFIDVSRVSQSLLAGGISRSVIELTKQFINGNHPYKLGFFTISNKGEIVSVANWAKDFLGLRESKLQRDVNFSPGDLVLCLDLSLPPRSLAPSTVDWLSGHGVSVVYFLYDLLPLAHPEFFKTGKPALFRVWLDAVVRAKIVISISADVEKRFIEFLGNIELNRTPVTRVLHLGSPDFEHETLSRKNAPHPTLLMVGTIEPRKGYPEALKIFEKLWLNGLDFGVVIVGRYGWKSASTRQTIRRLIHSGHKLQWQPSVSDDQLRNLYAESTFLLANSYAEGFGLPLAEARHIGLPIVCRDIPIFREVAPNSLFYSDLQELESSLETALLNPSKLTAQLTDKSDSQTRRWSDVYNDLVQIIQLKDY